jgi:hypothetical protein
LGVDKPRHRAARGADPDPDPQAITESVAHLKLLAGYFQKLEREARGYLKGPRQLEEALAALEGRRLSAEHAAAALASV